MLHVPLTERVPATHDIYAAPHKGLRLALTRLLVRLGNADWRNIKSSRQLLDDLDNQLDLSASHLKHEESFVHAVLEARMPGSTVRLERAHDHHTASFATLRSLIAALDDAGPEARPALGHELYLRFSMFLAEDLAHMAEEETVTLPLLQRLCTDAELMELERRIVASIPPGRMIAFMRVMLPAMSPDERAAMLQSLQESAPAEAFQAVIDMAARPCLVEHDWQDLSRRLQLAV